MSVSVRRAGRQEAGSALRLCTESPVCAAAVLGISLMFFSTLGLRYDVSLCWIRAISLAKKAGTCTHIP